jgi:large subunit ribosomal protein L6
MGFTHYIIKYCVNGIYLIGFKNKILLYGVDEQQVNQVAATIRDFRRRDAYRGKGIRYRDEIVELKVGKKR